MFDGGASGDTPAPAFALEYVCVGASVDQQHHGRMCSDADITTKCLCQMFMFILMRVVRGKRGCTVLMRRVSNESNSVEMRSRSIN